MTATELYTNRVEAIVQLLRDNVSDPNTSRASEGRNFIYDRFPYLTAEMPRISVTFLPHGDEEILDFDGTRLYVQPIQVDIWNHVKATFKINGEDYNKTKLLDYLADKVSSVLNDRQALAGYGIYDIRQTRMFGDMDSGEEDIIRSLGEYELYYLETQ